MDIGRYIFPFIMAVITNSLMIVIIYFLRKIPYFANLFSVWFMAILYLLCVLRIFVPIEFSDLQIIIRDKTVYPALVETIIDPDISKTNFHPNTVFLIILFIWGIGTLVIGAWSLIKHRRFKLYLMANGDYATDRERELFSDVAIEVLKRDKNITLRKTDVISGTMVIGLIHKTVLIPDEAYTDDELKMIFRHECMHIKNKDLWVKLLVQLYCCIFWWNPIAYLLKSDLDATLEVKCDLNATRGFSDTDKLAYVEVLASRCIAEKKTKSPFVAAAHFADSRKKSKLLERVKALLAEPPKKGGQVITTLLVAVLIISLFTASYIFIWQPRYENKVDEELYELADGDTIVDESNAYLVKQDDGNYLFYYSNYDPIPATKEEVESGMYDGYPIYEE